MLFVGKLQLLLAHGLAGGGFFGGLLCRGLVGLALVQVVGVVAGVAGDDAALAHLKDLLGGLVQEVAVVGDSQDGTGERL